MVDAVRKGDTIEIVAKGALHPGMRGAVQKVDDDGEVTALFQSGRFKVDAGEYVRIDARVGDTIEIVKSGKLAEGARGVIKRLRGDNEVEARFEEGEYDVDAGDYFVV